MTTLLYHHEDCLDHLVPHGHPERPDRIRAIMAALDDPAFDALQRRKPDEAEDAALLLAHPQAYLDALARAAPESGLVHVDADTVLSPGSLRAARLCVGAAVSAVDAVMAGEADNAFCALRPPGHHAEKTRAMGFCFFSTAAIAALHAVEVHGLSRVAIVDFDVHHGNGSQDVLWEEPRVLYASIHESPLYPGTGHEDETGAGNILNTPVPGGMTGGRWVERVEARIIPALEAFAPELLIISAGFDAHADDPLASLNVREADFVAVTDRLLAVAARSAKGRVVSVLEGGYDLDALGRSTAAHVRRLMAQPGSGESG